MERTREPRIAKGSIEPIGIAERVLVKTDDRVDSRTLLVVSLYPLEVKFDEAACCERSRGIRLVDL